MAVFHWQPCNLFFKYSFVSIEEWMSYYRIVGNFREAQVFAIFTIRYQLAKICSHKKFFLLNVLADESSTVPSSRRSNKLSESWPILSSKHRGNFSWPTINSPQLYILRVSSFPLAWQFFTDSNRHALISVEILLLFWHWKCMLWVTVSMREIVGGAVRYCNLVAKIKIAKFFFWCVRWWFAKIYDRENFPL